MPLSTKTKILLAVLAIFLMGVGGFIIYKQIENANRLDNIQRSIVDQKQLLDNISRAQAQYASKQDIEDFAKQRDIDLDVIKKDLDTLNAQIQAINGIIVLSQGQVGNHIPSTGTTPREEPPTGIGPDPYGYMTNTQHLALHEKFSNVEVPFGTVGFSAWQDKPWNISIAPRQYSVTSVLGQDENGRHYSYSKFAIKSDGKTYDVKIDDNKFLEEYPEAKFHWFNPKLHMFVNGGVGITKAPVQGEFTPGVSVGVMSYGKTKTNPALSILQVGIGYGVVNKTPELSISPIQYNIGQNLPLINNTYVGPTFQVNGTGGVTVGAGISVGL
jgi:hypothetical protein